MFGLQSLSLSFLSTHVGPELFAYERQIPQGAFLHAPLCAHAGFYPRLLKIALKGMSYHVPDMSAL